VHKIGPAELIAARAELNTASGASLDAISLGTPHASVGEIEQLAQLLQDQHEPLAKPIYVSTGRTAHQVCVDKGIVAPLEALGVIFVLDTCTYITSILDPSTRVVMTNSGKWAHYAPGNLGIDVVIATLGECVDSAISGAIRMRDDLFS
jgi:predicted aconitase